MFQSDDKEIFRRSRVSKDNVLQNPLWFHSCPKINNLIKFI